MAEHYGVKPKRFTKKWWEYFWDYYKIHVLVTAFALLIASVTIVQCATREKYDINAVYTGHSMYSPETEEKIQALLAEYIDDIDENGEKSVLFRQLTFSDKAGNEQYDYAVQTKLDMSFTEENTFIYIFDAQEAEIYVNRESTDRTFESVENWLGETDAPTLAAPDGTAYAVSIEESRLFHENGINSTGLYIMLRKNNSADSQNAAAYESSKKAAAAVAG